MLNFALEAAIMERTPIWAAGAQDWWDFTRSGRAKRGVGAMPAETRASDGWVENEAGLLVKRSANTRSMAGKGLLTYPTRTNLLLRSQDFSASWNLLRLTLSTKIAAPDGTTTADLLLDTAVAGTHVAIQTISKAASSIVYSSSVYVKANVRDIVEFRVSDQTGKGVRTVFNLTTATITTAATAFGTGFTAGSSSITNVGNGWYRIELRATSNTATVIGQEIYVADASGNISYTGNGSGLYIWGAQLEMGSFASPPILTSGTAATANGPQQVIDIGSRAALGVGGVIQVDLRDVTETSKAVFMLNDGTSNNYVVLYANRGSSTASLSVVNGGVQAQIDLPTAPATGLATYAFAVGANYAMARLVGASAPTANTVVTFPATLSKFALGGSGFDAGSNNYQLSKRLALWYGPTSQHFFDNVLWPKAQLLAQVA